MSTNLRSKYLIETDELATSLAAGNKLKMLDASYFLPQMGLNAQELFQKHRITADTVHFCPDKISEPDVNNTGLPHTFPSLEVFLSHVKRLDVQKNH